MISKKNSILLALLLMQALVIIFFYRPVPSPTLEKIDLTGGVTVDNITELTIVDDTGEQIAVARNGEKQWQIRSAGNRPLEADADRINDILKRLSTLASKRLVTRTAASHLRLHVAENKFERKISVKSQNGQTTTFFIGSSSSTQGVHFRVASQDEVYLVQGISTWEFETDIDSWRQKQVEAKEKKAAENTGQITSQ